MLHDIAYYSHLLWVFAGIVIIYTVSRHHDVFRGIPTRRISIGWLYGVLGLGSLLFLLVAFKLSSPPTVFWDYKNAYHAAGEAMLVGNRATLHSLMATGVEGGFVNIPIVAYIFVPLALLPPLLAAGLFTVAGLAMTIWTWEMLVRLCALGARERWILALLFLACGPLINAVKFGNLSYLLLAALAGGVVLLKSGRHGMAGFVLGVATVIKPPLALFGFFFLLRRDWAALPAYVSVGVVTLVLSLAVFGLQENWFWLETSILKNGGGWLTGFSAQSIPSLILSLEGRNMTDLVLVSPNCTSSLIYKVAAVILALGAGGAILVSQRSSSANSAIEPDKHFTTMEWQYLITLILSLVASPLTWSHYYAWTLIPAAYFLGLPNTSPAKSLERLTGWIAIALVIPLVTWPESNSYTGTISSLHALAGFHTLIGGLVWFAWVFYWLVKQSSVVAGDRAIMSHKMY